MKLTHSEAKYLINCCGYLLRDIPNIEKGISKLKITAITEATGEEERITHKLYINIFGKYRFLRDASRAVFHKSCFRYNGSTSYLLEV